MCGALSFALRRSVLKSESSFPSFVSRSSAQKPARYSSHERVFSDCCIYSTHCWSFVRQYRVSARCVRSRAMYSTTAPTNYCAYSLTLFSFKVFHLSRFFFWKSIRLRHVFANRMYSALMISRWKYFTQTHLDTYYSYTTNTKRQYPLLCAFVCESVCDYVDVAVVLVVIIIFVIPVFLRFSQQVDKWMRDGAYQGSSVLYSLYLSPSLCLPFSLTMWYWALLCEAHPKDSHRRYWTK